MIVPLPTAHCGACFSPGEYQYSYLEQLVEGDEDSVAAKTGKRTFKKDIIKAEIKLIDLPGEPPGYVP